jgi:hypothetical protein
MEAAAVAAAGPEPGGVGLAWSSADTRVDAAQLGIGEYIAADVHVLGALEGVEDWSIQERITRDSWDLGVVYDAGDVAVGRVVAIDASLLTLRYDSEPQAAAPALTSPSAPV